MTKKFVEDGSGESPLPGVKIIPPEEVRRFVITQAPKRAAGASGERVEPVEKHARTIATTEFFGATELADFINDNNDSGSAIIDVTDNEGRTFSRATLVETLTDGTLVYKIILAE